MNGFSEIIKIIQDKTPMTKGAIAHELGISGTQICFYESGTNKIGYARIVILTALLSRLGINRIKGKPTTTINIMAVIGLDNIQPMNKNEYADYAYAKDNETATP